MEMRQELVRHLGKIEGRLAIKTGIAAFLAYYLGGYLSQLLYKPDEIVSNLWSVISAIVVMQANLGGTYIAAWNRFLGVMIGSLLGGLFIEIIGSNGITIGVGVFCTVAACTFFNLKDSLRIATMSVAVVMTLYILHPTIGTWEFSFYRFLDSCIGITIGMVTAHLILPDEANQKIKKKLITVLSMLETQYEQTSNLEVNKELPEQFKDQTAQIREELQKIKDIFLESEMELADDKTSHDLEYTIMVLERLTDQIDIMDQIHKENLKSIINVKLRSSFQDLSNHISTAFRKIAAYYETGEKQFNDQFAIEIDQFNDALLKFRSTHSTRQFSFFDVEGFFVFFYSVRNVAEELSKLEQKLAQEESK